MLVVRIVHVCSGSCLQVSLNGAKDKQTTGVLRMCVRFLCTILGICTRGSDLDATLLAPIAEWRNGLALKTGIPKDKYVGAPASFLQVSKVCGATPRT